MDVSDEDGNGHPVLMNLDGWFLDLRCRNEKRKSKRKWYRPPLRSTNEFAQHTRIHRDVGDDKRISFGMMIVEPRTAQRNAKDQISLPDAPSVVSKSARIATLGQLWPNLQWTSAFIDF